MNEWQKMISDLKQIGFTQKQIGAEINCSQNYVSNLERGLCGKRLSHELAINLQKLWSKHCKDKACLQVLP
ncbi:helix-turn-helix transcriptional regulator [Acinetobacter ursingii]|uniref:helix-turn-helix domain-containing protein n=1 Tax=Acinetobacter ursingii TaxID=108980 RepID=UPI000CB20405|nr:helix-turn-helix transcriptional regulator [Acinetobacter ursingii]MDG9859401.1 helix-turn-helix transcriptional regulator [Acinetobacter ursingii]MDG9894913.1 helix-turn-helix transcriptional regulator [Acinetobacter ursingii]MDH0006605.1 helix-turn-helix transcriptional regulator [Acinetobacter ursingii]MDH0478408.1 helix-turn-helix transcriptional regulator [Acinetobacter ursingii]MDH2118975.1 helix-turn-helix transcriptional regulator [Acinetobacter ursingii]